MAPPVLFPFMAEAMGWTRGEVMVGLTLMVMVLAASSPLLALLVNRFGAKTVLCIGGLIVAMSTVLMGFYGHTYATYLVLCAFAGLGSSFATMLATQTIIVSWFNTRRAMAMGLVLGGGAIGGFVAPQIISAAVIMLDGDWRIGWFIIAIGGLVGAAITLATVRNRPSDMKQYPDGINPDKIAQNTSDKKITYRTSVDWTFGNVLKSPALWLIIVAVGTNLFLWNTVKNQAPFHLRDRSFSPADAAFFYSLSIGCSILGRFSIAALGDKIEPRFLVGISSILMLLGGVLFWFVSPDALWIAYAYPMLAGFAFGITYVCLPTMLGNYYGAKVFATVNGIAYPLVAIIELSATPLAGFLYDIQGSYFTVLLIGWIGTVIAFTSMMPCKPPEPKI
ncbi:CynX/NimT family MFS transporter [Chloroflexota bacterium]